ncbi:hypothetical protein PENSTE_c015G08459 [Penicillium steckii]|uniref:Arrestin-like N-terminal domain-containing protein n=1 Tax=Penicillium steckii TaxID=303698 RepID=A0A1V6T0V3_9EURO|nr:hypothetical protein PENSTE_c015G08459 [Penicillium steckii]
MEKSQLGLEFPSTHELYSNVKGDNLSQPIPASIVIHSGTRSLGLDQTREIRIYLIQKLSNRTRDSVGESEHILNRVYNQFLSKPQPRESYATRSCSIIEELSLRVPALPRDTQASDTQKIPFYMPILANIPGTTTTGVAKISYFIVAYMDNGDNSSTGVSKEIVFRHRTLLEQNSTQYTRLYPNSSVISKIFLSQNNIGATGFAFSIAAKIFLRCPATPTKRSSEFKCVAIRGFKWRIEEVAQVLQSHTGQDDLSGYDTVEEESSVRELANGFQKGYWSTQHNPLLQVASPQAVQQKDSSVDVVFEIKIPSSVTPAPKVDISSNDFELLSPESLPPSLQELLAFPPRHKISLTTEHRLKIDVLISEDTFDASTQKLVDRKPMRTALNATFPMSIIDRAEAHIDEMIFTGNLPCYQEIPDSPPKYETF